MVYHLNVLLESRNLSLQKQLHRRLTLVCQQFYPAVKDVNCSINKDELSNKKQTFISDLFSKK